MDGIPRLIVISNSGASRSKRSFHASVPVACRSKCYPPQVGDLLCHDLCWAEKIRGGMEMAVRAKFGGVSRILAQAPVVSAASGRWLGFVPMMACVRHICASVVVTIRMASKGVEHPII
jgi:hypothetical protein